MLPPPSSSSRITIKVTGGNHLLEIVPPVGQNVIGLLGVGFLIFWLFGWFEGEGFALREVLDPKTPLGVKLFLMLWLAGWTCGGLIAALLALGCLIRRPKERLLVESARLVWQPAAPILVAFTNQKLTFWRRLKALFCSWTIIFTRQQIRDISICRKHDTDDNTHTEHLVLNHGNDRYEIGASLDATDRKWLFEVLKSWNEQHGSPARAG